MAASIKLPTESIEDISKCDDDDLLNRFGTEEEKSEGFKPCHTGAKNLTRTVYGMEESGGRMPFWNIELRQRLESRARARLRYAEADAMIYE